MTDLPILYSFRRCPYAMRARLALAVSATSCRLREVALKNKPAEMLAVSPKGTVPVLVTADGQVIDESLAIMTWALGRQDPEDWLAPSDGGLIAENDGPFKASLDRYKYPSRYDLADPLPYRAEGIGFLTRLNGLLEQHPFLAGEQRSLADMAIFPFVRQFAEVDRVWFDELPMKPLQTWLATQLAAPLFQAVMGKYAPWKSGQDEPFFP
ncbi:glutathione S-transferase [Govanella unica]|uniref:Glutathione S-transferase n=1 Tax=Govanella unica TaxID=2975056 RepID=A0A9X3Z7M5_9PROT|nr:glutathione S-transferase [Govania unica]MDA5194311.1 glutathione S-transferase [Govania unica]